jgi:hypothetical protein
VGTLWACRRRRCCGTLVRLHAPAADALGFGKMFT